MDFLVVIVEFIDSMRTFLKYTQDSGDRRLKLGPQIKATPRLAAVGSPEGLIYWDHP